MPAQGEASRHDFTDGTQVRHDTVVFLGPTVCQAESGNDLVKDQRHVVALCGIAQRLPENREAAEALVEAGSTITPASSS